MRIAVTGAAARTAAGSLDDLIDHLARGQAAFSAQPPYPSEGLKNARCGRVEGLDGLRPAEQLLLDVVQRALTDAGPHGGSTGLVVGTSSGNLCGPWERWHRAVIAGEAADEAGTGRDGPTDVVARTLKLDGPTATLSVACVSGTAAFAIAEGWLRDGLCHRVVVAGVDALSLFVHAGFSGLGALAADLPRPFTEHHDGLLLGEGAAAIVLERTEGSVYLAGVGLSADAVHMTAPDREAGGAVQAARIAMTRGGVQAAQVRAVSVHGTGTPFNDGMEQVALDALFAVRPPIQLVKARIGHTMGAAGAIEAAVAIRSAEEGPVLSMSSAFGGMNASAVFGPRPGASVDPVQTLVSEALFPPTSVKQAWPDAPLRALRANRTVRAGIAAIAHALEVFGPLPDNAALVLGTTTGCRLTDLVYHERLVREGAAKVSRLQFAYTVPAAPICEASILFGIRGPLLCFIGSEALPEAERLVRWGHAPAAIALELEVRDATGPVHSVVRRVDRG